MAIEKYLDLSTAHLTKEDADKVQYMLDLAVAPLTIYPTAFYGWFIYVGTNELFVQEICQHCKSYGLSDAFCELLLKTCKEGCVFLRLDCDGPIDDTLPKFDW